MKNEDYAKEKFGNVLGKAFSDMSKTVDSLSTQEESEKAFSNLLSGFFGKDLSNIMNKQMEVSKFFEETLKENLDIVSSLKLTKEKFDLPSGTKLQIKLNLTID